MEIPKTLIPLTLTRMPSLQQTNSASQAATSISQGFVGLEGSTIPNVNEFAQFASSTVKKSSVLKFIRLHEPAALILRKLKGLNLVMAVGHASKSVMVPFIDLKR